MATREKPEKDILQLLEVWRTEFPILWHQVWAWRLLPVLQSIFTQKNTDRKSKPGKLHRQLSIKGKIGFRSSSWRSRCEVELCSGRALRSCSNRGICNLQDCRGAGGKKQLAPKYIHMLGYTSGPRARSASVQEYSNALHKLVRNREVLMLWVPGVSDNEVRWYLSETCNINSWTANKLIIYCEECKVCR